MKRPFAVIGFSSALTLIILNFLSIKWALAAFVAVSVLFVIFLANQTIRKAAVLPVSMLSAALACLIFIVSYYNVFLPQTALSEQTVNAEIYIVDVAEKTENGYSYTVKTKSLDLPDAPQNIKLTVYSDSRIDAQSYEILNTKISLFSTGSNAFESRGTFDDGIFLSGYLRAYRSLGTEIGGITRINQSFIELRDQLSSRFSTLVGGDEGALSLAVLTGNTASLSDAAYNNFKACGATHLMAVSGFNLAVLTGMLYKILRRMLVPKVPLILVCSASVWFYVLLAGFSSSMIRAAIMMLVFLLSKLFNERTDSLNSLGFAAFLICLDPYAVTDAGALLTFTAVLGLITVNPFLISKVRCKNKIIKNVLQTICSSVSVFVTTFPVMYFMFGEVSIAGIFLNVVLIPLSEVLMITAVFFSAFSSFGVIRSVTVFILKTVSGAMLGITEYFARFSFSKVTISSQFFALLIFCVFVLFAVAFLIKGFSGSRVFKPCAALSCVFALLISVFSVGYSSNHTFLRVLHGEYSNAVIVYNQDYALVLGLKEYNQYYTAQKIIDSNDLNTAMIIDYGGEYSFALAQESGCLNFVTENKEKTESLNCNFITAGQFTNTLWNGLTVSYIGQNGQQTVLLNIENTSFEFTEYDLANAEKYDIIYTVNDKGYSRKGVNRWAG